jgi:hypothetical protein
MNYGNSNPPLWLTVILVAAFVAVTLIQVPSMRGVFLFIAIVLAIGAIGLAPMIIRDIRSRKKDDRPATR